MANRDPAQGVINWFAALMVCVFVVSISVAVAGVWGIYVLVRHLQG